MLGIGTKGPAQLIQVGSKRVAAIPVPLVVQLQHVGKVALGGAAQAVFGDLGEEDRILRVGEGVGEQVDERLLAQLRE